jgi:hypothetical protein
LRQKIRPLWTAIVFKAELDRATTARIEDLLEQLEASFYLGINHNIICKINHLPDSIKRRWIELAYQELDGTRKFPIEDYIELLDNKELTIPRRSYCRKNLICLKGLIELIPDVENKLNTTLEALRGKNPELFNHCSPE